LHAGDCTACRPAQPSPGCQPALPDQTTAPACVFRGLAATPDIRSPAEPAAGTRRRQRPRHRRKDARNRVDVQRIRPPDTRPRANASNFRHFFRTGSIFLRLRAVSRFACHRTPNFLHPGRSVLECGGKQYPARRRFYPLRHRYSPLAEASSARIGKRM